MSTVIINIFKKGAVVYFTSEGPIPQLPIVKKYFDWKNKYASAICWWARERQLVYFVCRWQKLLDK